MKKSVSFCWFLYISTHKVISDVLYDICSIKHKIVYFFLKFLILISDVLALSASIGELSELTRRARTAQWCSLQAADKENPSLSKLGIDIQSLTMVKQASSEDNMDDKI